MEILVSSLLVSDDAATTTIASMEIASKNNYVHFVIGSVFILLGTVFFVMVRRLSQVVVLSNADDEQTSTVLSLFAVQGICLCSE